MDKIFYNLQAKIINDKPLTGNMFLSLAFEYTQAINEGYIPEILTSLERIISAEIRKITDDTLREYHEKVNKFITFQIIYFIGF